MFEIPDLFIFFFWGGGRGAVRPNILFIYLLLFYSILFYFILFFFWGGGVQSRC